MVIRPATRTDATERRPEASCTAPRRLGDKPVMVEARLALLSADIDLQQHRRCTPLLRRDAVDAPQEVERVDGLDGREEPHGLAGLIRLQAADEVPFDRR